MIYVGNQKDIDPLLRILEFNLFYRSFDDVNSFVRSISNEYMGYLESGPAFVSPDMKTYIQDEIESEVRSLLIKRLYGCVGSKEYQYVGNVSRISVKRHTIIPVFFDMEELKKNSQDEDTEDEG